MQNEDFSKNENMPSKYLGFKAVNKGRQSLNPLFKKNKVFKIEK